MSLFASRTDGYVYIARDGDGNIKVGGAKNVQRRLAQLRRKCGILNLVAEIRSERYMYLEKFLHLALAKYSIVREWYKNEKAVLATVIEFLSKHGEIFGAYDIHFIAPSRRK